MAAPAALFDTHCHLNHLDLAASSGQDSGSAHADAWVATWERAREAGVREAVVVGIDLPSSRTAAAIAARGRGLGLRWSAGLHPTETGDLERVWDGIRALVASPPDGAPAPSAVGETGFDFYWDKSTPEQQARGLRAHLQLASETDLPVILHCRDAFSATFDALEQWRDGHGGRLPAGVMHCFSGGVDEAERALDLGLYLSFAGPLTYPRSKALREAAAFAPADRILVETDTPFLPPQGRRGRPNEPAWMVTVAEKLAEVRGTDLTEIATVTTRNAHALFG